MKKIIGLAALTVIGLSSAFAQSMPGKIGSVTLSLTASNEVGGFKGEYNKTLVEKETTDGSIYKSAYKSAVAKSKYGNKQFIADLMSRYELPGSVADYSIVYVKDNDNEFEGYFITNKDRSIVEVIGSNSDSSSYSSMPITSYYTTDDYHESTLYNESENYSEIYKGSTYTEAYDGSYTYTAPGTYLYFNPLGEDRVESFCLVSGAGSYRYKYTEAEVTTETYTETIGQTLYDGIVGTNYDGTIITGSMTISALKDATDVLVFYDAYANYYFE